MGFSEIGTAAQLLRGILERSPAGAAAAAPRAVEPAPSAPPRTRAERLERTLAALCAAPGVAGAAVADASGLRVASVGDAPAADRLAAFTTLLEPAIDGAGRLLGTAPEQVTVRLSREEEAVVARFAVDGRSYHLAVLCRGGASARLDLRAAAGALAEALAAPASEVTP